MPFVQLVEFTTSRIDGVRKFSERYRENAKGKRKVQRGQLCIDRNQPNHYVSITEFKNQDEAIENAMLPETKEFAKNIDELTDGPVIFRSLEVIDAWEG